AWANVLCEGQGASVLGNGALLPKPAVRTMVGQVENDGRCALFPVRIASDAGSATIVNMIGIVRVACSNGTRALIELATTRPRGGGRGNSIAMRSRHRTHRPWDSGPSRGTCLDEQEPARPGWFPLCRARARPRARPHPRTPYSGDAAAEDWQNQRDRASSAAVDGRLGDSFEDAVELLSKSPQIATFCKIGREHSRWRLVG